MDQIVADFVNRFRSLGLTGEPSDVNAIDALEKHLGLQLPKAYRAYLLIAGSAPPPGLVGSDCHGASLFKLREWGLELLKQSGNPFELPADAVVFLVHQGYQFFYFHAGVTDDPPVFYYFENSPAPERKYERFSDWVAVVS